MYPIEFKTNHFPWYILKSLKGVFNKEGLFLFRTVLEFNRNYNKVFFNTEFQEYKYKEFVNFNIFKDSFKSYSKRDKFARIVYNKNFYFNLHFSNINERSSIERLDNLQLKIEKN